MTKSHSKLSFSVKKKGSMYFWSHTLDVDVNHLNHEKEIKVILHAAYINYCEY